MTPQHLREAQAGEARIGGLSPHACPFLARTDAACSAAKVLPPPPTQSQPRLGLREPALFCRPVIVGDEKGQLLEVVLDEKEKRDPPVKALYSFEDAPEKITGVEQHRAQQRTLVLVATALRLYVFVGDRELEPLFASYPESAGKSLRHISLTSIEGITCSLSCCAIASPSRIPHSYQPCKRGPG